MLFGRPLFERPSASAIRGLFISDTSYTDLQGLVDSDSKPEFVVPEGWIDSGREDGLELNLHTASNVLGCISDGVLARDRMGSGQPDDPNVGERDCLCSTGSRQLDRQHCHGALSD